MDLRPFRRCFGCASERMPRCASWRNDSETIGGTLVPGRLGEGLQRRGENMLDASAGHDVLRGRKIWFSAFGALSFLQVLNIRLTPREKRLEWKGKMANGKWVRGGRDKGMDSALWLSRRERDAGTRRQACRRVPALMALVFAVALIHFVCRRNSRNKGW